LRERSTNSVSSSRAVLLELGLDELDVRAGLLAVQHAGADLDRVADHAGGIVTGLLARPHQLDGRGSSIASPSTSTRLASTVTRVWRRGVAASIRRTSQAMPTT
jgi:hypothetical protein